MEFYQKMAISFVKYSNKKLNYHYNIFVILKNLANKNLTKSQNLYKKHIHKNLNKYTFTYVIKSSLEIYYFFQILHYIFSVNRRK